ncbi:MAG: hypothetical protein ACOY46_19090 [Bacillota bacterium]
MAENEREFHAETTVITPGIDLRNMKNKDDTIGKNRARTTVFGNY